MAVGIQYYMSDVKMLTVYHHRNFSYTNTNKWKPRWRVGVIIHNLQTYKPRRCTPGHSQVSKYALCFLNLLSCQPHYNRSHLRLINSLSSREILLRMSLKSNTTAVYYSTQSAALQTLTKLFVL